MATNKDRYIDFLRSKMAISQENGFQIDRSDITPTLYPHVKDSVEWAIRGGQRAIFSSFGMQKTVTQLEILRLIIKYKGGKGLIVCPKRVVVEFKTQAAKHLGFEVTYVRNQAEVESSQTDIMVTNFERVRDGDISPSYFIATSLDEASVLRGYGTKTYQTFLPLFEGVKYRFVATATPSPNRFKELIHYAGYLGVMDTGQALNRFFKRDSTKANNLQLYPGKETEFWFWVSSWALVLTKPSDLGYPDDGYELPELHIHEEMVSIKEEAEVSKDGQLKMFRDQAVSLSEGAKERKVALPSKIERIVEIINRPENKDSHFLIWHDLELERQEICKAVDGCRAVYGTQDEDEADEVVRQFKDGELKYLAAKPEMLGEGLNFQYHCHKAIMLIDYRFNDKFQAIHRIYRFMQKHDVELYLVFSETEQIIYQSFLKKWKQHNEMVDNLAGIFRENGLFTINPEEKLQRFMFGEREEVNSKLFRAINNDNVLECLNMEDDSVDLIVTSIPFSNHYEYSNTYNDFGHNTDNERFFEQMDYLTKELHRILKPGRLACIHVKDRVLFGNATGDGMPTIDPFSEMSVFHYLKHGFRYMGRITIDTDVVRENNQTYRLGYTEMCKDGSKMGVGCPEYVLLFRKLPTDTSRAYADTPVTKDKSEYSLGRWQIDACSHWQSSGDTLLTAYDFENMELDSVRHFYRQYSKKHVYDYGQHVALAERLGRLDRLPKTFNALEPVAKNANIWDDIVRMRTLNTIQIQRAKNLHLCPLQTDTVERLIERYSNKGELVFDPFGGIMTVPYCAVKMGRKGLACELNKDYFHDGVEHLRSAEMKSVAPTLFDLFEFEEHENEESL